MLPAGPSQLPCNSKHTTWAMGFFPLTLEAMESEESCDGTHEFMLIAACQPCTIQVVRIAHSVFHCQQLQSITKQADDC
jgi:hypothetical protein